MKKALSGVPKLLKMKVRHSGGYPTESKNYETHCFVDHRCSSFRPRRLRQGHQARLLRSRFQERKGLQEVVLPASRPTNKDQATLEGAWFFFAMASATESKNTGETVAFQSRSVVVVFQNSAVITKCTETTRIHRIQLTLASLQC